MQWFQVLQIENLTVWKPVKGLYLNIEYEGSGRLWILFMPFQIHIYTCPIV